MKHAFDRNMKIKSKTRRITMADNIKWWRYFLSSTVSAKKGVGLAILPKNIWIMREYSLHTWKSYGTNRIIAVKR